MILVFACADHAFQQPVADIDFQKREWDKEGSILRIAPIHKHLLQELFLHVL